MRPGQQQNKQRMRGRGRKGPNPLSRSYESNGPDVKIRGTAQHVAEKYLTLARDASASGDRVMAENYLQHAEHYGRIVAAAQGSFQVQRDEREVEYDEDGEEIIFDDGPQNGLAQPDAPQPQMRENRDAGQRDNSQRDSGQTHQNGQRDGYQRENRDGQNRDGQNRDGQYGQNRENRNRDGNRDYQNRENRDANRDYQSRDNNPARDPSQPAGEGQQNRDGQRNRDGQPRENRGNRGERNREFRQNRADGEQQGERAAQGQVPSGLGPQPFIGLPPAAPSFEAQPSPFQPAAHQPPVEAQAEAPSVSVPVPGPANVETPVEAYGDAPARAEGEPRRRGRPRRVRSDDGVAVAGEAFVPEPAATAAPVEAPVVEAPSAAAAGGDAPEGEVKAKRRPGRPRKKKTDDDAPEDGGDHLPAFLMASNG